MRTSFMDGPLLEKLKNPQAFSNLRALDLFHKNLKIFFSESLFSAPDPLLWLGTSFQFLASYVPESHYASFLMLLSV